MNSSILRTKLIIPQIHANLVSRSRLSKRIESGVQSGHKLTLVAAPAGFGKTTVVNSWARENKRHIAWLSLNNSDNDPKTFWTYMVASIQTVLPDFGKTMLTDLLSSPSSTTDSILPAFVNLLSNVEEPLIMVLDDYHVISNPEIHKDITFLLDHQPQQFHLVMTTRADPPLSIARLRAQQSLTEIRAGDLRFSYPEARAFLNNVMELGLAKEDIQLLETRTEGWIVGLLLAAQSLHGREDKNEFIKHLSGSQQFILEYLLEEVLEHQSDEVRNFLLETSILDQFCGSLCRALTGNKNSADIITQLNKDNLFIIPLDPEYTWFRYHHLFADLLNNFLQKEYSKEKILELHQRTSQWYQANDDIEKAVDYALSAQAYEQAAGLIEQVFDKIIARGQVLTLLDWLNAVPEAIIKGLPHLRIYHAWILSMNGQHKIAEEILNEVKAALKAQLDTPENRVLYGEASAHLAGIIMYTNDPPRVIREAQEALAYLPEEYLISRARIYVSMGTAYAYSGELELAIQNNKDASDLSLKANNPFLAATAIEMLAGLQIYHIGSLGEAIQILEQILELGKIGDDDYQSFTGTAHILLAEAYLERNNLEKTAELLETGFKLIKQAGIRYSLTHANCTQARLMIALGDIKGAAEAMNAAHSATLASPLMHILIHNQACQIKSALYMGDIQTASRWAEGDISLMKYEIPKEIPNYLKEVRQIAQVRVLLAQGELEKTLANLDKIHSQAESAGQMRHVIEICLLKSLALHKLGKSKEALASFEQCLSLAEPENIVRLFLEAGEEIEVLLETANANKRHTEYIHLLLDAYKHQQIETIDNLPANPPQEELIEPLTNRELEVLRLMCEGQSNQDIADTMIVSVNTVKKHSNNIYSKLGVKTRTQAVLKAQELNLV